MSRWILLAIMATLAVLPARAQSRILVCESTASPCTQMNVVWTFSGAQGTSSAGGTLNIEKFDSGSLVVRRTEPSGLVATYHGEVRNSRIQGTAEITWPGHEGYPKVENFAALLDDPMASGPTAYPATDEISGSLPTELLVCENSGPCNAAWILHGAEGAGTWFLHSTVHAKLTVVRASNDNILIRRQDSTGRPTLTYAGSLRNGHYSGVIVKNASDGIGETAGIWTASAPQTKCPAGTDVGSALSTGQTALMFKRNRDALDCYTVAAGDGDARAQTTVGLLYEQGSGDLPQDYKQALYWLRKAADQGVYVAQRRLAEMYITGLGTPPDEALARVYNARADEQKHDYERQQDLEEHEADRRTQVLSSFVLGASFGLFF